MSALRAVLGGAAGAAAYNAYQESESSSLGGMASSLFDAFQRKGASQMAEVGRRGRGARTGKALGFARARGRLLGLVCCLASCGWACGACGK